jgi:hypothetical protein
MYGWLIVYLGTDWYDESSNVNDNEFRRIKAPFYVKLTLFIFDLDPSPSYNFFSTCRAAAY